MTTAVLDGPPRAWPRLPPIGTPLPHVEIYVLDPAAKPVGRGQPGEVFIGGNALARGYLGEEDLTAERFVDNPFGPGRMYRTGDLARMFPSGQLQFLGRVDRQVKIRGFRIEPAEVEATLERCTDVIECAVLPTEGPRGRLRLVAYVVAKDATASRGDGDTSERGGSWRRALAAELPSHMVPSEFVQVPELPRTPTGKIDRARLGSTAGRAGLGRSHVAPSTPTEITVTHVWREALRLEDVGVLDEFVELGGDSLLLVEVRRMLEDALGIDVPIGVLVESPTVRVLAARLDRGQDSGPERDDYSRRRQQLASQRTALRRRAMSDARLDDRRP